MLSLDTGQLTALLTALTGLVAALSAGAAKRQARIQREQRALKRGQREMQRVVNASLRHIFAMEQRLSARGITPPDRPAELEQFYEDTEDEDPGHADTAARDQPPDEAAGGDPGTAAARRRRHARSG